MSRIGAVVAAVRAVPSIQVHFADLDGDPLLANCANGTYDVRTGGGGRTTPRTPVTQSCRSHTSRLLAAVASAPTGGDDGGPTNDTAQFVEISLGYALLGGNPEDGIFFIIGPAGTGRLQLVEVPNAAVGTDYSRVFKPSLIARGRSDEGPSRDDGRATRAVN